VSVFATSVDRLANRVGHWEQARWWSRPALAHSGLSRAAGAALPTHGDLLYTLVQRLADLGADAEGRRRRPVPRLTDLVLPDQLRVMADDLGAAAPPEDVLELAADAVDALRRIL
jgi:hypothetical protein